MKFSVKYLLLSIPFIVVLSTVYVVSHDLGNGIVSGKYFWFYLSMGLAAVVVVGTALVSSNKVQFSWLDGLVLLYGLATLVFSKYIHHSEVITKHILLLLILLLYFYFRFVLQINKQILYWLALAFLLTGLVEAVWGLRQLYGLDHSQHSLFKTTGSFFNPGPYASYLAVILPASLYYLLRHWNCHKVKFRLRYWAIYLRWLITTLTFISIILVLPATMSRTSWIAGIGGCSLVGLHFMLKNKKLKVYFKQNKKWVAIITSSLVITVLIGSVGMYYLKKDSADGRTLIWKNSHSTALSNPFGVGIGRFSASYGHTQAAYFQSGQGTEQERYVAGNPEYAFNEYLQIAVEQGILSLVLFLCIVGYSLYVGIKQKKIAPAASLLALLIVAISSYPFSVLPFLIVLALLLDWLQSDKKGKLLPKPITAIAALCSLAIVAVCLYNRYPTYHAYKEWDKHNFFIGGAYASRTIKIYDEIYPQLSDQKKFLFEYAQILFNVKEYEKSIEVLQKAVQIDCDPMFYNVMGKNYQALAMYKEAKQSFIKASNIVPNRIYPNYLLAKFYLEIGDNGKALEIARHTLTRQAKVPSMAEKEIHQEMKNIIDKNRE